MEDLYRDNIIDHYQNPRNYGTLENPDISYEDSNPVCGDEISLCLALDGDTIRDVFADCRGCSISVASASMLAELLPGKTLEAARCVLAAFKGMMHGEPPPKDLDMGDLDALQGVQKFPVRVKCALLAWVTLEDALRARGGAGAGRASTTEE